MVRESTCVLEGKDPESTRKKKLVVPGTPNVFPAMD
jgi:hypothetical protein